MINEHVLIENSGPRVTNGWRLAIVLFYQKKRKKHLVVLWQILSEWLNASWMWNEIFVYKIELTMSLTGVHDAGQLMNLWI